mgnify:CR=1 FL=1
MQKKEKKKKKDVRVKTVDNVKGVFCGRWLAGVMHFR